MRRAMGLIAGPQRPPVRLPRNGRKVCAVEHHGLEGVDEREAVGAGAQRGRAGDSVTSRTLGVSLASRKRPVTSRHGGDDRRRGRGVGADLQAAGDVGARDVELVALDARHGAGRPPRRGAPRGAATTAAYCSGVVAADADDDRLPQRGPLRQPAIQASMPGFSRPMALIMPAGVSVTRGGGLPVRASTVTVLGT